MTVKDLNDARDRAKVIHLLEFKIREAMQERDSEDKLASLLEELQRRCEECQQWLESHREPTGKFAIVWPDYSADYAE